MKNSIRSFFIVVACLVAGATLLQAQPQANDYWVVVPAAYTTQSSGNPSRLLLSSETPMKVRVQWTGAGSTVNVTKNGVIVSGIPEMTNHLVVTNNKGIHVFAIGADTTKSFSCALLAGGEERFAATLCIPTSSLGKRYCVASYAAFDSVASNGTTLTYGSEMAIVATDSATQIKITFPAATGKPPITITLNRGQTYHINGARPDIGFDLSGTIVESNKPIAVYSGHLGAGIPIGTFFSTTDGLADELLDEMIPTRSWGKVYHLVPTPNRPADSYRIFADSDATNVYLDGSVVPVAMLNAGNFYEMQQTGAHEITSSKPVQVVQYAQTAIKSYSGGPAQTTLIPPSEYFSSAHFGFQLLSGFATSTMITILAPTSRTSAVLFDGSTITTPFTAIPSSGTNIPYSYAVVPIANDGHTLRYADTPSCGANSLMAYLSGNDGDKDETMLYNVGGYAPKLLGKFAMTSEVKGDSLYFKLFCNQTNGQKTFSILNVGFAGLVIDSLKILGTTEFAVPSPTVLPITLAPKGSQKVVVDFNPATFNVLRTGKLRIHYHIPLGDCVSDSVKVQDIALSGFAPGKVLDRLPGSINFLGIYTCSTTIDTIIHIINSGTTPVTVTKATFASSGYLSVKSPGIPFDVPANTTVDMIIHFDPTNLPPGLFQDSVLIQTSSCDLQANFEAFRGKPTFTVAPLAVIVGHTKTRTDNITITNTTPVGIIISNAFLSLNIPADIVSPSSFPTNIPLNGTLDVVMKTRASAPVGIYPGKLYTVVCSDTIAQDVTVEVREEQVTFCPQPERTALATSKPGDIVSIPVHMDKPLKSTTATSATITVTYDPHLLRIGSVTSTRCGSVNVTNSSPGSITFTVTGCTAPIDSGIIASLLSQVLLAPYTEASMAVTVADVPEPSIENNIVANVGPCEAPVRVDSSCVQPNQVKDRSSAQITGVYPNPSRGASVVEITAEGAPTVKVEVYDVFGRTVETLFNGTLSAGKHELKFTSERYSVGKYFVRLVQGSLVTAEPFNVEK